MSSRTFVLIFMLICSIGLASAALDVSITLEGPSNLLPGEAGNVSVTATLSGVPIISFPAEANITLPDSTVLPFTLTNTNQGSYVGSVLSVQEGMHLVTVAVILDGEAFIATHSIMVAAPTHTIEVEATLTNGTIAGTVSQDSPGDFTLSLAPFSTGDVQTKRYVQACTFSCGTECTFSCPAASGAQLARFTTNRDYEYTVYTPVGTGPVPVNVTYDEVTGIEETELVTLSERAEVYTLFGRTLNQIPLSGESYAFTPLVEANGSIIVKSGDYITVLPVQVVRRTNVQQFSPQEASDGPNSWWYGFVSAERETLLRLPHDPGLREAYMLSANSRTPLSWEKGYVVMPAGTGFIEIKRAQPADAPANSTATPYGSLIGGQGLHRYEIAGRVQAFGTGLDELPSYWNGSTSVLYVQDDTAAVVHDAQGTLSVTQPLMTASEGSIQYRVGNGTPQEGATVTFSVYTRLGQLMQQLSFAGESGARTLLFTLPPGSYIAVVDGTTNAGAGLVVYSEEPSIALSEAQVLHGKENSELVITHSITNSDLLQRRVVDLQAESEFTVLINATDTNNNGLVDVTLQPGQTATFTSTAFIPPGASEGTVTFNATSEELSASVTDTVAVESATVPVYSDADITSIGGAAEQPVVHIQNNDDSQLVGTLYVSGNQLTTQLAVTLAPGMNNISVPAVGTRITARIQVAGDMQPENNERTRDFRTPASTRLVRINEQLHADHEQYTVQLPTTPGFTLVWIDDAGEHHASAQFDGANTLWDLGSVPANHEFYAGLVPGEPVQETLSAVIDNAHPSVSKRGTWVAATSAPGYIGFDYLTDLNLEKSGSVIYAPSLARDRYAIRIHNPADASFADNVPVTINGVPSATVMFNQRQGGWQYLGLYELTAGSSVVIENRHTLSFVVADAVEFTRVSQIGGMVLAGDSSLARSVKVGAPERISLGAYLDSVERIETPGEVTVQRGEREITLIASKPGTYVVVVRDASRALTITLEAHEPELDLPFKTTLLTPYGELPATLYVEQDFASLVSAGSRESLGEATGWVFDVEINLSGKKINIERAYIPNYTLPLTVSAITEDRSGRMFLIDAYSIRRNGLQAQQITIEDIADASQLMSCSELPNGRCKWSAVEPLYIEQFYSHTFSGDITLAEASVLDPHTKKKGQKQNRGPNWERVEHGNSGQLSVSAYPRFFEQEDGFVPINTTFVLGDGVQNLESAGAYVQVKDNMFQTRANLESGDGLLTLTDKRGAATISVPQRGVRGKAVGNKIVYSDITPGVDLEYSVGTGTLKELYIIEDTDAPKSYVSTINMPNTVMEQTPELYVFRNRTSGEIAWAVWKPFAYDEWGKNDTPGHRTALQTTVTQNGDNYTFTTQMDQEWFTSEERVFPVYLDPTLVSGTLSGTDGGYVRTGEPTFFDDDLAVGEFGAANQMANGFVRLAMGSTLPPTAVITEANFSAGIQEDTGWDPGVDTTYFSFLNTTLASTFWNDNFRESTEYNQGAITNLYTFAQSTNDAQGPYQFTVNSTGLTGLQRILVQDQQGYITVRFSYDSASEASHQSNNEYISWYTGIDCCGVTYDGGIVIPPTLNVTYIFENVTPTLSSASFNQTDYNSTQTVKLGVTITEATSGIENVAVLINDSINVTTNYTLQPSQSSTSVTGTVSSASQSFTAANVTSTLFSDDFTYTSGGDPSQILWTETGGDWIITGGRANSDDTGGAGSPDYITPVPTISLSGQDAGRITFDWETTAIEAPDCLGLELYNGTAWGSVMTRCTAGASGSWQQNITASQYLTNTFNMRFSANGNDDTGGGQDDMYIDNVVVTSWRAHNQNSTDPVQYDDITTGTLRNLSSLAFTVQVSGYDPRGSVNRGNSKPDLQLEVYGTGGWVTVGTFNLPGTYTGSGFNSTARNFTLSTSDSTVISAWESSRYQRDIRIRATSIDYVSSALRDQVNYTAVYFNHTQTGGDTYERTWAPSTLSGVGRYNGTQIFTNDTAGNINVTNYNTLNFTLFSFASVSSRATPGGVPAYPNDVTLTCTVTDPILGGPIPGYNVSMFSNVTGFIGEFTTDANGNASTVHSVTEQSQLSCVISNRTDLYYYTNTSSHFRIVAIDTEPPVWTQWSLGIVNSINVSNGISVNRTNTTLQARSYWIDNIGLDTSSIEHNASGAFVNYTVGNFDGVNESWANYTFDLSDGGEFAYVGLINVSKIWMLDFVPWTNYTSPSLYFYLYGTVNLTSAAVDPASPAILEPTDAICHVSDLYDIPAIGYNVSFYRNGTLLGSALTDSAGDAILSFSTASIGSYQLNCTITDYVGDYFYLGTPTLQSVTFSVVPDSTAPRVENVTTNPTSGMLGSALTINASLYDVAGIGSAYGNITVPTGSSASSTLSGSGNTYSGTYTPSAEGFHELRITATDPSLNTNVSAYTHFIAGGRAVANIQTALTRYNSNSDVDLNQSIVVSSGDREAGTQSHSAPVTTTQITGISAYFSNTGSCAGATRNGAAAANSCRRAGYVDGGTKQWGGPVLRTGWTGSNTLSANEIVGAVMFNLSGIPDDAALTSGYMRITVQSENGWDNGDDAIVYAHTPSDNNVWDSNGPEQTQLQTIQSSPEFTITTIDGTLLNGAAGNTLSFVFDSTMLGYIEGHFASDGLMVTLDEGNSGSSEYVSFESGFNGSSTATDPELAFNYTSPTVDYNSTQINYTDVIAGAMTELTAIRINVTVSSTDFTASNATFNIGSGRMPALRVNVYNGTGYQQKYACDVLQRGVRINTTAGTCSIVIRDSNIISAWLTAANRDVQLQAINLDNRNEGIDYINWTGVTVELFNKSHIINSGPTSLTGNVELTVERDNSGWVYNATIYNSSQALSSGQVLDLASLWNATAWSTGDRAEGSYRAVVRMLNSSDQRMPQGDGGYVEGTYTFTINDTVAPTVVNSLPVNNSTIWGMNPAGASFAYNATDATGFTNCSLYLNTTIYNTTTAVNNSVSTTLRAYSIPEGTYLWHVACFDNASARNRGLSTNWTVHVDNTAPYVNITTLNEYNFSVTTMNISFTVIDNYSTTITWRAFVNGAVNTSGSTSNNTPTNATLTGMAEGRHVIRIEGTDEGGLSANSTINITVDLTPPYPRILTSNNSFFNTTTPQISFNITDNLSTLLNYTFYVNNQANATGQTTNSTTSSANMIQVPDGNHSVKVQGTDMAGNRANSTSIQILVDLNTPTVTLNSPAEGYNTSSTSVDFNWTYTDAWSPNATCSVYVNATLNSTATAFNNTAKNVTVTGFPEGRHNWTVTCIDLAGNTGSAGVVRNFTVDLSAPTINLVSPANLSTYITTRNVTLTYNVTDVLTSVSSCDLHVDGVYNQTMSAAEDTNLQFNLTDLDNGDYTWRVLCNDTVGNAGSSLINTFFVNVTALAESPASETVVDRDSFSADPDVLTLTANLTDGRNGATVSFYANLTSPAIGGQSDILLGTNTTNASGHAVLYFNPNSTMYAGNYTWWATEVRSLSNSSLTFHVYGSATLNYSSATANPNTEYNGSQRVYMDFNVTSVGPESAAVLNASYGLNVTTNLTQPNGTVQTVSAAPYNGSLWNASYLLPADAEIGYWNVTAYTAGSWFYSAASTTPRNFTVKGLASAAGPAAGSVVDRDEVSTDPDVLVLTAYISGATLPYMVNFTANLTTPVVGGQTRLVLGNNTTNSTGYAVFYFNPDSSYYAGNYTWWVESDVSYPDDDNNLNIKGSLNIAFRNNTYEPNASSLQNETARYEINLTSNGPESRDELNSTYSVDVLVDVWTPITGSVDLYTAVYDTVGDYWQTTSPLTAGEPDEWTATIQHLSPFFYTNSTNRTFDVFGFMNVTSNTSTPSSIYAFQYVTTSCILQNQHTDHFVNNATVMFYVDGVYAGQNTTAISSGEANLTHQINTTGAHTVTCNVTDQPGIYYYAGDAPEGNSTVTVTAFPVGAAGLANGTRVDRDGVDATDPDVILLNISVPSYVPDGQNIEFLANLTSPSISGQAYILLGNNTTNGGYALLYYGPNSTSYAGNWSWFGNHSAGYVNETRNYLSIGGLNATYRNNTYDPNSSYYQNDLATAEANISSLGPESASELNSSYSLLANNTYTNGSGTANIVGLVFSGTYWQNTTFTIPQNQGNGTWNTTVNAAASYFYSNSTTRAMTVLRSTVCINETGVCMPTVQRAHDNATDGQTLVIIDNGTYNENVTITKSITITSNDTGVPTIASYNNNTLHSLAVPSPTIVLRRLNLSLSGSTFDTHVISESATSIYLTVEDVSFWVNSSEDGSVITNGGATPVTSLNRVNITIINATRGVYDNSGNLTINNTRIEGFINGTGGAIFGSADGVKTVENTFVNLTGGRGMQAGGSSSFKMLTNVTIYSPERAVVIANAEIVNSLLNSTGMSANGRALVADPGSTTVRNSVLQSNTTRCVSLGSGNSTLTIIDSTIEGPCASRVILSSQAGNTHNVTLINVTGSTPANTDYNGGTCAGGTCVATFQNYLDVYVNDTTAAPVNAATVNATTISSVLRFSVLTDAAGRIVRQNITYANQSNDGVTTFTDYHDNHTVAAVKTGYAPDSKSTNMSTYQFVNLTLGEYVNITEATLSPSNIYAFQYTTLTCRVQNQRNDSAVSGATVNMYRNGTFIGSNTTNSTGYTTLTFQVNTTGTHAILCNATDQPTLYYFRGSEPERNASLTVDSFHIAALSPANSTVVDRDAADASDPEVILLNVSVPSFVPDGQDIEFRANLTDPAIIGQTNVLLGNNTTSSGYAVIYYNPNSTSYAGNWTWYGLHTAGTPNATLHYISKGGLLAAFRNNTYEPNSTYNQTHTMLFEANLTSLASETSSELNMTYGAQAGVALTSPAGTNTSAALEFFDPYWNGSFAISSLNEVGNWTARVISNASYFYDNNSSNRSVLVYGLANATSITLTPSTIYAYQSTVAECRVIDALSTAVSGYTVSFYRDATFLGNNTTNSSGHAQYSFRTNVSGTYSVNCSITDNLSAYYYALDTTDNTTLVVNQFPITPVSPANDTLVDRDSTAADPDVVLLNVSIPSEVPDGIAIEFRANLTDPVIGGQTDVLIGNNTSSLGYAVLYYNPNSTSYAGNWTWFGEEAEGTANGTLTFLSRGSYTVAYNHTLNPNSTYFQNETVTSEVNLTSLGLETRAELNTSYLAAVNNTFTNTSSSTSVVGLPFNGTLWRNTTFTILTMQGVGIWNTTASSAAQHFYAPADAARNFTVYGYMNVTSNVTSPSSIFAFQYTTTTCRVQNQYTDGAVNGANVTFWRNGTLVGSNTTNSTGYAELAFQTTVAGTYAVYCNITDQPAIYYYAGDEPERNTTLTVIPYPIAAVAPANDTPTDRDETNASMSDVILINASVPAYVPDGENIEFRANLTDPVIGAQTYLLLGNNTTSSGTVLLYFNPNSTMYAGNYTWWGNSTDGLANSTLTALVYGQINVTFRNSTFEPNASHFQNETAIVEVNITTLGPESRDQVNATYLASGTGTFTNSTSASSSNSLSYTNPYWNNTFTLLDIEGVGVWNVTAEASASFLFWNQTPARSMTVYGYMNVTSNATSPSTAYAFDTVTTTCRVEDQHTGADVSNANITFWRDATYLGSNLTNGTGYANFSYTNPVSGTYTIYCNVTDQPAIYYYAGDEPERTTNLTIVPFPIASESPANGTRLDRDGVDATDQDLVMLNVSVPSFVPDGQDIEFRANLTDPAIIGQTNVLLGNNTTSSGYAVIYYNPNSTSYAGNWTWYGLHTAGTPNATLHYISIGGLDVTYRNNTLQPNATYFQNESVVVETNVSSFGPETRDQLNNTYTLSVNSTLSNASGPDLKAQSYTSPYWNASHTILDLAGVGAWTSTLNASDAYFYHNGTSRAFTVYGYANVTNVTAASSSIIVFQNATFMCRVQDQHTSADVANGNVTFYDNGTLVGVNATNSTGWTTLTWQVNSSGTRNVTCDFGTQPSIYYYAGDERNLSASLDVSRYLLATTSPANGSIADRDGVHADTDVLTLTAQAQTWVPAGRDVQFYMNITVPGLGYTDVLVGNNTTNSSGGISLSFNPNSTTYAGEWAWWADEIEADPFNSSTMVIKGALNLTFENSTYDPDANYTQDETVRISANLTSLGPETRDELNSSYNGIANVTLTPPIVAAKLKNLTYNGTVWNASHTILDVPTEVGVWNVSLLAIADYFYDSAVSPGAVQRNTTIYGYMNVTANSTTPDAHFAFESTLSVCRVQNELTSADVVGANVTFWRNTTLVGSNTTNATGYAQLYFPTNVAGNYTIYCNVTDQPEIYYLQGAEPERNMSLTVWRYPINAENPANDTPADRDETNASMSDVILLNASVPAYVPDGENIEFRANLTDPVIGGQTNLVLGNNTTSGNTALLYFNPNSSFYAGNYTWWGVSSEGGPNRTLTYLVYGQIVVEFENATLNPDANYTENGTAGVYVNITTLGPETRDQVNASYLASGTTTFTNSTGDNASSPISYTNPYWNGTFSFLDLGGIANWNITAEAAAQYLFFGQSAIRNTTVFGYANVTSIKLVPNPIDAYGYVAMTCRVQNQHTGVYVDGMNVSFYRNDTYIGSNLTNVSGYAQIYSQETVQGVFTVVCNITDDLSVYYYAGDIPNASATLNVTPILLTPVSPVNGTDVDRDGVHADPDTVTLVGQTKAGVPDGIVIDFWANLTDPVVGGQSDIYIGSNITNGTYINFTLDANSTMYAGNYVWWMNSSGGTPNGTRNFDVYGGLNLTFNSSSDPNATYVEDETVIINMTLLSFGVETADELNNTYNATANVTLGRPANGNTSLNLTYTGTLWNASHNIATAPPDVGVWNVSSLAVARYFYEAADAPGARNFTVYGYSFASLFDSEEYYGGKIFANSNGTYLVNYTNSLGETLSAGTCIIDYYDSTGNSMSYNIIKLLHEHIRMFSLEGIVRYNVTCGAPYYLAATNASNASIMSTVNVSLDVNVSSLADGVYLVTMNVTNLQNYTEHDIWPYHFVPAGYGVSYYDTPFDTAAVQGMFNGNSTRWYIPNLTAGESILVRYNVSGIEDIPKLYQSGIQVYSANTSIVY